MCVCVCQTLSIEASTSCAIIINNTVEPPNKEHVGDNTSLPVVSSVERLSSFRGSKCIREKLFLGDSDLCPL